VIPLARRYSFAALLLFAIAALPIWLDRTMRVSSDPCSSPEEIRRLGAYGEIGADYAVREIGDRGTSGHILWVDGRLRRNVRGVPLRFRVVRSANPSIFYGDLHEFFFVPLLPEDSREIRALNAGSDVLPVHQRNDFSNRPARLTRYLFAVGVEPVTHPLSGGLSRALDQLARGTQPVTLFLISGVAMNASRHDVEAQAESWLAAVWSDYRRVCRS
jgi:hypothetical protein